MEWNQLELWSVLHHLSILYQGSDKTWNRMEHNGTNWGTH